MINKNAPILIIGFGSIGQRHYNNLQKLGFKNISVFDVDKKKLKSVRQVEKLDKTNLEEFKIVFICNPNNLHINTALLCAQSGCDLFIEKPLSHSLSGVENIEKICQKSNLITMVGCNMRFHPCISFIHKYIAQGNLGSIYRILHEFGHYLPLWRPGVDYRNTYSSKKNQGGGIILDDIHEFDLLFWMNNFCDVAHSKFIFNKSSDLDINTEDNCIASFEFKNKVLGIVQCDYLQKKYSRTCKIIGEKGNLEWDFDENIVWLKDSKQKKKLFESKKFSLNNMYVDEIKYFLSSIEKKKKTFNDIKTAKQVLYYCVNRK